MSLSRILAQKSTPSPFAEEPFVSRSRVLLTTAWELNCHPLCRYGPYPSKGMTQYNSNSPTSNSSDCNQGVVSDSNFSFSGFTEVCYLQIHQNCSNQTAPSDPSAARKRHHFKQHLITR